MPEENTYGAIDVSFDILFDDWCFEDINNKKTVGV